MKVLIVGYGNMGKEVEAVLQERGHSVSGRVDPHASGADLPELTHESLEQSDVVIEFSLADSVIPNCRHYARSRTPAVVGTTGWYESADKAKEITEGSGIGYLYGSNFSIGAHLFFEMTKRLASIINPFSDYDIMMYELHHKHKKDSPSGTALNLGDAIIENCRRKTKPAVETLHREIEAEELHIGSVRGGSIPGTHTVIADSPADSLEITHRARSRKGFAAGAVGAAEWLVSRQGFFRVEDYISELLSEGRQA
jgi:4-hydroxy-tetrahydrodipicolinate reductase